MRGLLNLDNRGQLVNQAMAIGAVALALGVCFAVIGGMGLTQTYPADNTDNVGNSAKNASQTTTNILYQIFQVMGFGVIVMAFVFILYAVAKRRYGDEDEE